MSEAQERQEIGFDPASHASPGQMLQRERERQQLSLDEVAVQLNLRPAVVAGLEADRYDEVPIAAYRRGYLRAYARLLGIDEKPVVTAYNTQQGAEDLDRKVTPVQTTRPPSRLGAWIFKLVTVLVILGLIGLTLLWWQSRNGNDLMDGLGTSESVDVESLDGEPANDVASASPDAAADENDAATLPPLPAEGEELGLVDDDATSRNDASMIQPDTAPTGPGSSVDEAEAPTADEIATAQAAEATAEETADEQAVTEDAQAASEEEQTASEDEQAAGEETVAGTATHRLSLTFNEQSWTEIYDANGRRILVGLQSAGTQATTEGEPPFRLTIGNASGVELSYRGEAVDLGARAGGNNVARFTLGE